MRHRLHWPPYLLLGGERLSAAGERSLEQRGPAAQPGVDVYSARSDSQDTLVEQTERQLFAIFRRGVQNIRIRLQLAGQRLEGTVQNIRVEQILAPEIRFRLLGVHKLE